MSKNDIVLQLSWAMGCIGLIAFILNVLVIIYILYQGLRTVHKSKVIIFSLSFADGIFSLGAIIHCLIRQELIELKSNSGRKTARICLSTVLGLAFVSSIFHLTFITIERLVTAKYPIQHTIQFTYTRILKILITIWFISIFMTSTQFWIKRAVIDWFVTVAIVLACCNFIVTYIYLGRISAPHKKKFVCTQAVTEQHHVILLNSIKTIAFILCTLPFAIAQIIQMDKWDPLVSMIIYILLTMNTMLDPIIYTLLQKRLIQNKSIPTNITA